MNRSHKPAPPPVNAAFAAYTLAAGGLMLYGLPLAWAFSRVLDKPLPGLKQRLGVLPKEAAKQAGGSPRIWIHASSVGETVVARAVAEALRDVFPRAGFAVSAFTPHGLAHARQIFDGLTPCIYSPLDFFGPVQKALRTLRPDVMVFVETEIWPQWLFQARRMGAAPVIVNGRISPRSVKTYLRFKELFAPALNNVSAFSMISSQDAERIRRMGAPANRVFVSGNAKYDQLASQATLQRKETIPALLPDAEGPVVAAGSTRKGEETAVLDMFQAVLSRHPKALCILAPRHVRRCPEICVQIKGRGLKWETLTRLRQNGRPAGGASVLVVDEIGVLFDLYSLADVVFCGGSLVNLGGQNVMEPAAWGKPVLFGPHMDDFIQARDLLMESGGGLPLQDAGDLTRQVMRLLDYPALARNMGTRARQAVLAHQGAAGKHAQIIANVLEGRLS